MLKFIIEKLNKSFLIVCKNAPTQHIPISGFSCSKDGGGHACLQFCRQFMVYFHSAKYLPQLHSQLSIGTESNGGSYIQTDLYTKPALPVFGFLLLFEFLGKNWRTGFCTFLRYSTAYVKNPNIQKVLFVFFT